jgi:hypothetical protein
MTEAIESTAEDLGTEVVLVDRPPTTRGHSWGFGPHNHRYGAGGLSFDGERWLVKARNGGSVRWARVLMMDHLRRDLRSDEHVHHKNGDYNDDRIENLEVFDIRAHGALHGREAWKARKAAWLHEWSEHYAACVECGTTDQPHQGRGLCRRCDSRLRQRARRAARGKA